MSAVSAGLIGAAIGFLIVEPLGVWLGGKAREEKGSIIGAYAGNALGLATGILAAIKIREKNISHGNELAIGFAITLPISGSIIGYNMTRNCWKRSRID
jgi:uncharacterized protein YcfJ